MAARNCKARVPSVRPQKTTHNPSEISTAYHEAGHAVAALFLHLRIGRKGVTIIPNKITNALGSAHVLLQLRERRDISISPRTHIRIENLAVVDFAGDAAEKKFNPRRRFGGYTDMQYAVDLHTYISASEEILSARLKVARLRACDLVDSRWKEITAVAKALLDRKTLTREEVRQAIMGELVCSAGLPS